MDFRIWMYILIILAIVDFMMGFYFLKKDVEKYRRESNKKLILVDSGFIILFVVHICLIVMIWLNFYNQAY